MMTQKQALMGYPLSRLFDGLADQLPSLSILGLSQDSRRIEAGWLFLACAGHQAHGASYMEQAIGHGAVAVAYEPTAEVHGLEQAGLPVPVFAVPGLSAQLSELAGRFYAHPSHEMTVFGVTGTNGKTSVSHFIAQALAEDHQTGLIGTLGSGRYGQLRETGHTTPDAISIQAELAHLRDAGVRQVVMEVSSHALVQGRVAALRIEHAIFTNLTHEHLDYHGDMASYAAAKRLLFAMPGLRKAIVNVDDATGREWLAREDWPAALELLRYGLAQGSGEALPHELLGEGLQLERDGLSMRIGGALGAGELRTGLLGRFNAANLLAALGGLLAMDMPLDEALRRLTKVRTVPGRMEGFGGKARPLVVVDYAHTPDALAKVLEALREHTRGRLWCVFGCGGERDQQKRPQMGRIAEALADSVIITDDNPRMEDPYEIIEQILDGMSDPDAVYVNRTRAAAIAHAIALGRPDDVILVAGKGHEQEQLIGRQRLAFSDRAEVARLLGEEVRRG